MNLLSDPIFRCEPASLRTLPEVFQGLAQGHVRSFPALRPHQRAAWHMFLVQLGVLTAEKVGWPDEAAGWVDALRSLSEFGDEPWTLVVEDRCLPAFLQPPDPGGLKWTSVPTPDALDMLITSKNHDLKTQVATDAMPEDWVFALVTLQTMEGFGGAGNYGIARMNGGSSSRPMLTAAPASEQGAIDLPGWWRRDVKRLLEIRRTQPDCVGRIGGQTLLWCMPWPEREQLSVTELDPLFVEVCRRIRFSQDSGKIKAERSSSKAARIDAKAFKGVLGDPWAPVHRGENKALTLGSKDFDYRTIKDLLYNPDWEVPPLAKESPGEQSSELLLVAEAISRGNSKTDGLKRRVIPLPESGSWYADNAASAAEEMMKDISSVDNALREGVALFAARGSRDDVGKEQRLSAASARRRFDQSVDRIFFEFLWRRVDAEQVGDPLEARRVFCAELVRFARVELEAAFSSIPIAHTWEPRARTRANGRFRGALSKSGIPEEAIHV